MAFWLENGRSSVLLICSSEQCSEDTGPSLDTCFNSLGWRLVRAVSLNSLSFLLWGSVASRLGLSLIPYLPSGSVENGRGKPLVRVLLPYLLL
jgi:hypothetical protein